MTNRVLYLSVEGVAKAKMDEHGKVQIPLAAIRKLGLKSGTEFELTQADGVLVLKPIVQKHPSVKSPPLSASEMADIEESEREFAAGESHVYENDTDLINALHAERDKVQTAKRRNRNSL